MAIIKLKISDITQDTRTQSRAHIDAATVKEYAERIQEGDIFPPIIAFYDGTKYWLSEGWHRIWAAAMASPLKLEAEIEADVKSGTLEDAIVWSAGANKQHGMQRTNADKKKVVETLLLLPSWSRKSDREIGRYCGVSQPFVSALRKKLVASGKLKATFWEGDNRYHHSDDDLFVPDNEEDRFAYLRKTLRGTGNSPEESDRMAAELTELLNKRDAIQPPPIGQETESTDLGNCAYCGDAFNKDNLPYTDHVHPLSMGGDDDPSNLKDSCKSCNSAKRSFSLEEFRRYRERELFQTQEGIEVSAAQFNWIWKHALTCTHLKLPTYVFFFEKNKKP